jgi:hypothetical protein
MSTLSEPRLMISRRSLTQVIVKPLDSTSDPLVYDLDDPNCDGMHDEDEALAPGTIIQVVVDN